ncbi:MAG: iron transporter permease [Novosphingobium sp.]|nr:iron transporter permease [Novosphingobium sp.]
MTASMQPRMSHTALCLGLTAVLAALMLSSLMIGYVSIPMEKLVSAAFGLGDERTGIIVQQLRMPRMLLAVLVGASLGGAGAVLQGLLHNPLAEPGTLGISGAATLGAVVAIYFGLVGIMPFWLPICAMTGAGAATAILLWVGRETGSTLTLILVGTGIGGVSIALTSLAMNLSPNPYAVSEIAMWMLGSVKDRTFTEVTLAAPFVGVGLILLLTVAPSLNTLSLGEDTARTLGLNVARTRVLAIVGTSLSVGAGVAVTGGVGFVGLMMPHLVRPLVGHVPSRLVLPSIIGGGALVLLADICVRLIAVGPELQLGVLTSLAGTPFFLYLVIHLRKQLR